MIRAQLLACCSEELGDELDNFHSAQLDQKNEADLRAEMRKLAVVAHLKCSFWHERRRCSRSPLGGRLATT